MSDNGHKMDEEERRAEIKKELEKKKEQCEAKLDEFKDWLLSLQDCQAHAIRDHCGEMAAFYMSRSPNNLVVLANPDLLLDIVSLTVYAFWDGMEIEKANERERGKK